MNYFYLLSVFILLQICISTSSLIKPKSLFTRNDTSLNLRQRIAAKTEKFKNYSSSARQRFENHIDGNDDDNEQHSSNDQTTSVVVLTSLSGIYVWWPVLFGGDDSFHLLLTQEDVPRFHDVAGDNHGHIYLTAPHERTVYRLQYSDGWWISNFSNHSVMNSIRSEMPLFLTIHHISSIVYVYGHSDIQIIDLLQRPRARGSAPFMKRLRELSPNLRISDLIIDQLKSDGYIIGDSYGWCTVIRCALGVDECEFLFKLPSSYDNRPYPCTGTIDFTKKIIYLSLEEKILAIHLNAQTNYDRREILAEKRGARSTLGYDDIVAYKDVIFYTDVLRPLLHLCILTNSEPCLNISLIFSSPQRSILPLRLNVIQVSNLRPPVLDEDEDDIELHINQSNTDSSLLSLVDSNRTTKIQRLVDGTSTKSIVHKEQIVGNIWMLILGICIGLLLAGVSFMVYYVIWNKNRPACKKDSTEKGNQSANKRLIPTERQFSSIPASPETNTPLTGDMFESISENSSETTTTLTSSPSYQPDLIL